MPPSVNSLYATNKETHVRFKAKCYKDWIKAATDCLWVQQRKFLKGPVKVTYVFGRSNNGRKQDAFNYEKALTDLLYGNWECPNTYSR